MKSYLDIHPRMYPERGRGESKGTLTYVPGEVARGE